MTNLAQLRFLLEHIHSYEHCSRILTETANLFDERDGWFFHLLNETIRSVIDDQDTFYGVRESVPSPTLEAISLAGLHGIAAIELGDEAELKKAAQELTVLPE
jgi:hypothetical protein